VKHKDKTSLNTKIKRLIDVLSQFIFKSATKNAFRDKSNIYYHIRSMVKAATYTQPYLLECNNFYEN
jgi:hypothetical protein